MICTSYRPGFENTTCAEASKFARMLLIPEDRVKNLVDNQGIKNIGKLAEKFEVPAFIMKIRVIELGYKLKE